MTTTKIASLVFSSLVAGISVLPANAEVSKIAIADQQSLAFLPTMVMKHEKLLEAEVKKAGLGNIPVSWHTFAGGNTATDAMLAGELQFAFSGITPFITLWAKSNGKVKGVVATSSQPEYLNCRDPKLKSVRDLTGSEKIVVPAIKVSTQAVFLQMEAAKIWGDDQYQRLDSMTVAMSQADGSVALLSGNKEITCSFTSQPFTFLQLKKPDIHTILNSFDTLGGPATLTMAWTTTEFKDKNPKTYEAFLAAYKKALDIIHNDKPRAAKIYIEESKDRSITGNDVVKIISDPQITFVETPENTMKSVLFMKKVGRITAAPNDWKDMWFENVHNLKGS